MSDQPELTAEQIEEMESFGHIHCGAKSCSHNQLERTGRLTCNLKRVGLNDKGQCLAFRKNMTKRFLIPEQE